MTILTNDGREWYGDYAIGTADRLSTVAVGTGNGSEDSTSSSLSAEAHRSDHQDSIVFFTDEATTGRIIAHIEITGGTEVPGGTTITEIGVFAGLSGASGPLVWVDEFPGVTIEAGFTREFEVPINH